MEEAKVLVLDIETRPLEVYTWELGEQHISIGQIKKDWGVIAWAAKWLGDSPTKVIYHDLRGNPNGDDKSLLIPLWALLDQADIVVTQNGQKFDGPKLNARFILHGMRPPSPYKHLDTYQIVKRVAQFTSNKLEYLTDKLCTKYKKLSHAEYPGLSLWLQCLAGNVKAWEAMRKYNIHDVLSTEELYLKVRAWAPQSMPKVFHSLRVRVCETCGSNALQSRGFERVKTAKYRRYQCQSCGKWQRGERVKEAA